jgi:MoxR-like ATPase
MAVNGRRPGQTGQKARNMTTPLENAIARLQDVRTDLRKASVEREDPSDLVILAALAQKPAILVGPPGTGKSFVVNEFARRVQDPAGGGLRVWQTLCGKEDSRDTYWGPISISALKQDRYVRNTAGTLAEAHIAILEEMFRASDSSLENLLQAINERVYSEAGVRTAIPLMTAFAATNTLPQTEALAAIRDRFPIVYKFDYISAAGLRQVIDRRMRRCAPKSYLALADLVLLQEAVRAMDLPPAITSAVITLRKSLADKGITVSDRRWEWLCDVISAHALLEGRMSVEEDDLGVLEHGLWDDEAQHLVVYKELARLQSPTVAQAIGARDKAHEEYTVWTKAQSEYASNRDMAMRSTSEANSRFAEIMDELAGLLEQARADGRGVAKIEEQIARVEAEQREVLVAMLGKAAVARLGR